MTDSTNGKPQPKKYIDSWTINAAMRDLYDLIEMAMLPYILVGDVARQIYDGIEGFNGNDIKADKIEWAMFEKNLTPEVKSLFTVWGFEPWEDKGFKYSFQGVPIYVHVITRKYKFFEVPDMKFYGPDFFKLPNPFENYWKARYLIK